MDVNIHCFGGIDESNPIIEIRTFCGYGARWSGRWHSDENVFESVEDVEFRGFLEPQVCMYYALTMLSFLFPYSYMHTFYFLCLDGRWT